MSDRRWFSALSEAAAARAEETGERGPELRDFLTLCPPRQFDRGDTLIHNTYHRAAPRPDTSPASVAYVVEGLVRGAWNGPFIAPETRATTLVAGDGRWVGLDAIKYGANLFRYDALTPTSACVVPLSYLLNDAPRALLVDALRCVTLDWCSAASVLSLGNEPLERRTMLLLYNLFRLHPRPELEVRQQDVAELLGVRRQTLQPVLGELQAAGLVTLGYGEICVGNADALLAELRATPERAGRPRSRRPRSAGDGADDVSPPA